MPVLASSYRTHRSLSLRGMLTVTSAIAGATLIGLSTIGGTYALWVDSESLDPGIVTSGSLTLKIDGNDHAELGADLAQMLPGDQLTETIELSNLGTVDADLTAVTSASGELDVRFRQGDCDAPNSLPTANSNGSAVPLGSLAAGSDAIICLEATLSPSAVAPTADSGAALPLAVTITATQKTA